MSTSCLVGFGMLADPRAALCWEASGRDWLGELLEKRLQQSSSSVILRL